MGLETWLEFNPSISYWEPHDDNKNQLSGVGLHMFTLVCMHVCVHMLILVCMHVCVHMLTLACTHVRVHTHKSISQYNKDILTQPTPFRKELVLHLLVRNLVYSKLLLHLISLKTYILPASISGTYVEKNKHALTCFSV